MVSIISLLEAKEWNKEESLLEKSDKLTVHGEKAGAPIHVNSCRGTVANAINAENYIYKITGQHETQHRMEQFGLMYWKRHSKALRHVSDDNICDRHSM